MIIIFRHFRIAKAGKISLALPPGPLYLLRPVERPVDDMNIAPRLQKGQTIVNDLFQGREIFHRSRKDNTVKLPVPQNTRTDVAVDEPQVRIVAEDPRGLLELRKIDIDTCHLGAGNFREMM